MDVFKSQNPVLFKSLRDFLTGLPNSSCGEDILTMAFHRLAVTDVKASRWLLQNSRDLLPEINFIELAVELAKALLQAQGFVAGQDFSFEPNGRVILSAKAQSGLLEETSIGDRLLLEEILHVHD